MLIPREEKLARRYPILRQVPGPERAGIVREALRNPLFIIVFIVLALGAGPFYLEYAFALLDMPHGENMLVQLAKMGSVILLPICILVPVLTRLVMPRTIRKVMLKRGYTVE